METLVYTFLIVVSLGISVKCLVSEIKENGHRNINENVGQACGESHNPRRHSFDELALRIRDTHDPLVTEILEQTKDVRERRSSNNMPFDREKTEMRANTSSDAGTETTTESDHRHQC